MHLDADTEQAAAGARENSADAVSVAVTSAGASAKALSADIEQGVAPADAGGQPSAELKMADSEEEHEDAAVAPEPPFELAFAPLAPPFVFWQDLAIVMIMGGVLGCFGYAFLKAISKVTDLWLSAGNPAFPGPAALQFGAGRAWWVGLAAGTGLAVGLAKWLFDLETTPSFLTELQAMHVDPLRGAKTGVVVLMGLLGGVPMGPEAGLGAVAGAAGTLVGQLRKPRIRRAMRRKLLVITSMCSAFASFLPNPMCAILLTIELGHTPRRLGISYTHLTAALSAGSTVAFVCYYAIAGYTYLNPGALFVTAAAAQRYDQMYVVEGILFGVGGAAMAVCYLLIAGVSRGLLRRAAAALEARIGRWPRVVIMCCAGGVAYGLLGWAMPLTLTDGSATLATVGINSGAIGSGTLAASAFGKMLAYHIAAESGFAGGLFLPIMSMSAMMGAVFVNETNVDPAIAMACSLIALGAGLMAAPAFLSLVTISILSVGPAGLVPVFATASTSYLLCVGIGIPQAVIAAAARRGERKALPRG